MKTCPKCKAPMEEGVFSCPHCAAVPEIPRPIESPFGSEQEETTLFSSNRETLSEALGRRYSIVGKLGSGAFGEVYKAWDTALNRYVAIKRIRLDTLADASRVDEVKLRFQREAQVAAQLRHPHIVTIHDIVASSSTSFIVMELIEGETLQSLLEKKGRLPLGETIDILAQAADALDHAHENGVIHRDVKPANILIERSGRVTVTDFGIAKAESTGNITATGSILGTPNYMSPEQALGKHLDGRSDLFSLGSVLYECLTGTRPFRGDTATAVLVQIIHEEPPPIDLDATGLPAAVVGVVHRVLAKDPAARYSSGAEIVRALRSLSTVDIHGPTMEIGATRAIPPRAPETRREAARESRRPALPASKKEGAAETPATTRRGPSATRDRTRWTGATVLLLAVVVGARWWMNRPTIPDEAQPDAPEGATKDEPAAPPRTQPTGETPVQPSSSEPTPSAPVPRTERPKQTEEAPPAAGSASLDARILANEQAAVEALIRLSRMQARAQSEVGRYLTAQQIFQRMRILRGAPRGAGPRGNLWSANGYLFDLEVPRPDLYVAFAVPADYGQSGIHSFYIDTDGVVRGADRGGERASRTDPPFRPDAPRP